MAITTVGTPDGNAPLLTGRQVSEVRNLRLDDGSLATLTIDNGVILAVERTDPHAPRSEADQSDANTAIDASGWRYLPAATEPHAHLDKALTGARVAPAADNSLAAAIGEWQRILPAIDAADLNARALDAIRRYVAHGITTIRTHVDALLTGDPLRAIDTLIALRDALSTSVNLQICLLASEATPNAVIRDAIERGIDVIGGCPHLTTDAPAETRRLLDLAEESGLPVDLHTDEQSNTSHIDLVDLAEQVLARGMQQRVAASHCVRLAMLSPQRLTEVLELVKRAAIDIITLPITNLYLQSRDARPPMPRGIPPMRAVLDAGIKLAAGGDNMLDPFMPLGRADPFETASLLVIAGHLSTQEARHAVTTAGREVLGLPPAAAERGCAADFLLVPDLPMDEILAGAQPARLVIHGGRVVADTRVRSIVDESLFFNQQAVR